MTLSPRNSSEQTAQAHQETLGIWAESDNDDSVSFACSTCPTCGRFAKRKYCSHACYCEAIRLPIEPRFWSHVNKHGPVHPVLGTRCWLWTANRVGRVSKNYPSQSQHGQFTYSVNQRQRHVYAHRFAWELKHGPIPPGMQVCHRCDVPLCVNDAHHFLGTQGDNLKDAARKGRLTVPRNGLLSLYDRLRIYREPAYRGVCVTLAREYGVSRACISVIRSGRFLGSGVWHGTKAEVEEGTCVVKRVVRLVETA